VFTPVLAKHSKSFSLIDYISVGVDRMQRNFEPMRTQVEAWQKCELSDVTAKVVIYEAFVEGKLEAPKHLARTVHDLYFEPRYEEFRRRTIWSLSNAFTSAFKELDQSLNSRLPPNWASSWRRGSRRLFNNAWRCGAGPPMLTYSLLSGRRRAEADASPDPLISQKSVCGQSGRRRRACALASVRRPNCTCGFPACSFHEDT